MLRSWARHTVLLTLIFVSCSGDSGRTTLTFWHFWPKTVIQPILDDFEATHPDSRIESQQLTWQSGFEKIVLAFASNTAPDLCEIGSTWVPRFASDGVLWRLPVDPISLQTEYHLTGPAVFDGGVYALPWLVGTRALFCNRTLFETAGLDPNDPPETWPDLLDAARRIDRLGAEVHGFGTNAGERHVLYKKFMPFAWSNGGRILTADGSVQFNSPENLVALRFFLELAKVSLVEKQAVLDQVFKEERIGMMISGSWNLKSIPQDAPGLDFGVARVPRPDSPSGEHISFGGAEMLVIPQASGQKEAARNLAEFLIQPEQAWRIAREVQSVWPSSKNAQDTAGELDSKVRVFVEQMETTRTAPAHPRWVDIEEILDIRLEEALYGRISPEEALRRAHEEIEDVLR
jgi:multiple sugar transport system substrate-binding protein